MTGTRMTRLALIWMALTLSATTAQAKWARFALVVGYNDSDDPALAPLRYADDDAVKYAQVLAATTERTVLLTDLDTASRRVFGGAKARRPTRDNVFSALKSLRADMAKARARGDKPLLYFVYSGHGNYDQEGRGYVHVHGGRITTRDIYYDVLGPTEGEEPHHVVLVVDACNAALLVNSRGSDRRRAKRTSLRLEDYPRVGVILSASTVAEVHEWGKYLSGIFSHEVRSALLGAGDIDDDGAVGFAELAAFVASANVEVKNEVYRLQPYIRPPMDQPNLPLVDKSTAHFPARVRIGDAFAGKAHLLDSELLRHADFHKAGGHGFWLGLPGDGGYRLVTDKAEYVVPPGARGDLQLAGLARVPLTTLSKRGADEYFEKRLFARAQSPAAARGWLRDSYEASLVVERFERLPWYENGPAWSLAGSAAAALGAGAGFHGWAVGAHNKAVRTPYADEARAHNQAASSRMTAAWALYGVGSAAMIGSVLWFALDDRYETSRYRPPVRVDVGPGGVQLRTRF